jgi:hypothetical protein
MINRRGAKTQSKTFFIISYAFGITNNNSKCFSRRLCASAVKIFSVNNRTAFLAHCEIPPIHGHNRTVFLAHCEIRPPGMVEVRKMQGAIFSPPIHGHKKTATGYFTTSGFLWIN